MRIPVRVARRLGPVLVLGALVALAPLYGCAPRGPTVTGVVPAPAATGLRVDTVLTLRFDAPVSGVPAGAVTISPVPDGGVALELRDGGRELRVAPARAWAPATAYSLTITRAVQDQAGRPLRREFRTTFTTAAARTATCSRPVFSPQGGLVAWMQESGGDWSAWMAPADGSAAPVRLASGLWPQSEAVWLPDGTGLLVTVAVSRTPGGRPAPRLAVVSIESKAVVELPLNQHLTDVERLRAAFSPDGRRLAVQNDMYLADAHSDYQRQLGVAAADGTGWRDFGNLLVGWTSNTTLLWLHLPGIGEGHSFDYCWRRYDDATGTVSRVPQLPRFNNLADAARSPDGRYFALSSWAAEEVQTAEGWEIQRRPRDIWLLDLDGPTLDRLALGTGRNGEPAWTPDGGLLFASDREGHWDIWQVRSLAGSLSPENLTRRPGYDGQPDAAAGWVAFVSDASGNHEVWVMRPDGTGLRQLSR